MKRQWNRLREYMNKSLRRQLMFYLMAGVLLPLTVVTSALFYKTRLEMKSQAVGNIRQRASAIAARIDELIYNIQGVSDKFAYDEEIDYCINENYENQTFEKQKDIYELNTYFDNTDPLKKSQRISALYTKQKEVFNFLNPNQQKDIRSKMIELGAIDGANLSMFCWYPLQENFLVDTKAGDIRKDKVLFGVRRILNPFTGTWLYTQFFAIEEEKVFQLYEGSVEEMMGIIYITDKDGGLISSSDINTVNTGHVPQEIIKLAKETQKGDYQVNKDYQVNYEGENYIIDLHYLSNVDWNLITMVPVSAATAPIDRLFKEIIAAMLVCVIACVVIITWISRRFLQPVEVLDASMKEVYDGNLEAYVNPDSYSGEIKSMMTYYNAMLVQINHYIKDQVDSEKKKKELELEVLMGQINPHFLYNTLENIVWKSNEVGRPDIGRIAAALGRLYRLSIGNGETIVPIKQELEHVNAYVNIQKNRYKERMEFDMNVDYDQIYGYSMIKLTLQPVVENCFMYAMEDIDHLLRIRLDIKVYKDIIRFRIADNGCGMTKEQLEHVRNQIDNGAARAEKFYGKQKRKGTGIGLYSVKERIAIYTGYKDSIKVSSKAGFGTIVTITIPKIPSKDKYCQ